MEKGNTEAFRLFLASPTAGNSERNCKLCFERDRLRASASNYAGSNCYIVCLYLNRCILCTAKIIISSLPQSLPLFLLALSKAQPEMLYDFPREIKRAQAYGPVISIQLVNMHQLNHGNCLCTHS